MKRIFFGIIALVGLILTFGSKGAYDSSFDFSNQKTITISHTPWDDAIVSSQVVGQVLEDEGYHIEYVQLDPAILFSSLATGESDFSVSPWLPNSHGPFYERFKDNLDIVGVHTNQALDALVVPSYMEVNSIDELTNQANKVITGIEPGAGLTTAVDRVMEEYENLADWEHSVSSTGAMLTQLDQAIANKEEIVFAGWNPHWMFIEYDLKPLEDPKGTFGEGEGIYTVARQDFKEDSPEVYDVISNFEWPIEELAGLMLEMQEGTPARQAARQWIDNNPEKVAEWTQSLEN